MGPEFFAALVALDPNAEEGQVKRCSIDELYAGMIIQQDVQTHGGSLLVSTGQEVTPTVISKLKNFHARGSINEYVKVSSPKSTLSFVKGLRRTGWGRGRTRENCDDLGYSLHFVAEFRVEASKSRGEGFRA